MLIKRCLFNCVFLIGLLIPLLHAQELSAQDDFHFEGSNWELVNFGPIDSTDLQEDDVFFWLMMGLVEAKESPSVIIFNFNERNKFDVTSNDTIVNKGQYKYTPKHKKLVINLRDERWKYKVDVIDDKQIELQSESRNVFMKLKRVK